MIGNRNGAQDIGLEGVHLWMDTQNLLDPDALQQHNPSTIGVDGLVVDLVPILHIVQDARSLGRFSAPRPIRVLQLPAPTRGKALNGRCNGAHVGRHLGAVVLLDGLRVPRGLGLPHSLCVPCGSP